MSQRGRPRDPLKIWVGCLSPAVSYEGVLELTQQLEVADAVRQVTILPAVPSDFGEDPSPPSAAGPPCALSDPTLAEIPASCPMGISTCGAKFDACCVL
jgi:hypothetical protein